MYVLLNDSFVEDASLVAIVGGYPAFYDVEILNVTSTVANSNCEKPTNHPIRNGAVSTIFNGTLFTCGGWTGSFRSSDQCYQYDKTSDQWTQAWKMTLARLYSASVMINQTHWWITGGYSSSSSTALTEICNIPLRQCSAYQPLPTSSAFHTMLKVNETHFIMCGEGQKVWIFDQIEEQWTDLPATDYNHDEGICCMVFNEGEKEVVVAGGVSTNTAEIYNFATEKWRMTDSITDDSRLYRSQSVPHGNSFLVIGGHSSVNKDKVLYFNPSTETWDELPVKLQRARNVFAAVAIPEAFAICN